VDRARHGVLLPVHLELHPQQLVPVGQGAVRLLEAGDVPVLLELQRVRAKVAGDAFQGDPEHPALFRHRGAGRGRLLAQFMAAQPDGGGPGPVRDPGFLQVRDEPVEFETEREQLVGGGHAFAPGWFSRILRRGDKKNRPDAGRPSGVRR